MKEKRNATALLEQSGTYEEEHWLDNKLDFC
jgi:hypothetical protein